MENIEDIITGFHEGQLAGISNGSYHKEWTLSSAAWAMVNKAVRTAICGGGIIPGPPRK